MQDNPDTTSSPVPCGRSPIPWIVMAHLALLAVLFGSALNYSSTHYVLFAFAAVVLAQASLISIWLVLGWGSAKAKLVILVCLPLLFLVFPGVVCPILVFVLPLVFTQSDGLRLTRFTPADLPPPRTLQFSMIQLMRVTIVVIVLFALGQFGPGQREVYAARLGEFGNVLTVIGVVVVGLACAGTVVTIPVVCVWAVLSPGKVLPRLGVALVGWMLGVVLLIHYVGGVSEPLGASVAVAGLATTILLATLLAMRPFGYRAVWQVEPGDPPSSRIPS